MSVTHLAGPLVGFRGRGIQRCAVCGEKLSDNKNQAAPLNPDGSAPEMSSWTEGHLIQWEDGNPSHESDIGEFITVDPPDDFCISLVE